MNIEINTNKNLNGLGDWVQLEKPQEGTDGIAGHEINQAPADAVRRQQNQVVADTLKNSMDENWVFVEREGLNETGGLRVQEGDFEKLAQDNLMPDQKAEYRKMVMVMGLYADSCKKLMEGAIQEKLGYVGTTIEFPRNTQLEDELKQIYKTALEQLRCAVTRTEYVDKAGNKSYPLEGSVQKFLLTQFLAAGERFAAQVKGEKNELSDLAASNYAQRIVTYHRMSQTSDTESPTQKLVHLKRTLQFALSEFEQRMAAERKNEEEFEADDGFVYDYVDKFGTNYDAKDRIRWLLDDNARFNDPRMSEQERTAARVAVLEKLLTAVVAENYDKVGGVQDIAFSQGYDAEVNHKMEVEKRLNSYSAAAIFQYVKDTQHGYLTGDPKFRVYVLQHAGDLPRAYQDGDVVLKAGGWDDDKAYYQILESVITRKNADGDVARADKLSVEAEVPNDVLMKRYSLGDFRLLFHYDGNGAFKTALKETTGTLTVDTYGVLGNGGDKASFENLGLNPETSVVLCMKLVDAFRQEGADETFLKMAESALGLNGGDVQPVPRRVIKDLLIRFDALMSKRPSEAKETEEAPSETFTTSAPNAYKRLTERKVTVHENSSSEPTIESEKPKTTVEQPQNTTTQPKSFLQTPNQVESRAKELLGGDWKLTNNPGGGSCFFYAALQGNGFIPGKVVGVRDYSEKAANDLRTRLVQYEQDTLQNHANLKGLRREQDSYLYQGDDGFTQGNAIPVTEAVSQAKDSLFRSTPQDADLAHAAFLASMLKRPVVIISDLAGSKTEPEAMRFEYDITTGTKLQGDPIVIYYSGSYRSSGGHFQVLTPVQ